MHINLHTRRGHQTPCKLLCGCWKLNSQLCPLQRQYVLLASQVLSFISMFLQTRKGLFILSIGVAQSDLIEGVLQSCEWIQ